MLINNSDLHKLHSDSFEDPNLHGAEQLEVPESRQPAEVNDTFGEESAANYDEMLAVLMQVQYQSNKDRYVGGIDPVTKMREGEGCYTYHQNPFFQYQGAYERGVKASNPGGVSTLIMRDGSRLTGEFQKGEITGRGVKVWESGKIYKGHFLKGEMHGEGFLQYQDSKRMEDQSYEGSFHLNSREGQGTLIKKNGDHIVGSFRQNQPNGQVKIQFASGEFYQGNVIRGYMNGQGHLEALNNQSFEGEFFDGKLHGEGRYFIKDGSYSLSGQFKHGEPEFKASKYLFEVISPSEQEEDSKGKKDPKKGTTIDDMEGTGNAIKIILDTSNSVESQRQLSFRIRVVFQGEPYEDPNPPEEDETAKKKKGKEAHEPEIRMITPDPVVMTQESGREFEFSLGRMEKVRVDLPPKESSANLGRVSGDIIMNTASGSIQNIQESEEAEAEYEERWVQYHFDQRKTGEDDPRIVHYTTKEGVLEVEGLEFKMDPLWMPGGLFELSITDVTKGIKDSDLLEPLKVDLKVFDSVQEAEEAAQLAAEKKGKKK